jgi:hypothetical protein
MTIHDLCQILLGTDQLRINHIEIDHSTIHLVVESKTHQAHCPACTHESKTIHSWYVRCPVDLAWAAWRVIIHLHVKRFFCHNPTCPKRTFAERFSDFVARYARSMNLVPENNNGGWNTCARLAVRLLAMDHIALSDTHLNRLIRSLSYPNPSPVWG